MTIVMVMGSVLVVAVMRVMAMISIRKMVLLVNMVNDAEDALLIAMTVAPMMVLWFDIR